MHGFPPIIDDDCNVLILGSFPSAESLRQQEYYAYKYNSFWKIAFALFDEPYRPDYEQKKTLLLRHHIALWDVLYSHEGSGSADADIKNPMPNDFPSFFKRYTGLNYIFFNGGASEQLFTKLVSKDFLPENISCSRLYSTSPANARYRFEEKQQNWSQIKVVLSKSNPG